jgi:hypothetical protein
MRRDTAAMCIGGAIDDVRRNVWSEVHSLSSPPHAMKRLQSMFVIGRLHSLTLTAQHPWSLTRKPRPHRT